MPAQKSQKGRLTAAQETREVPRPRGHIRKPKLSETHHQKVKPGRYMKISRSD